ncbi:MAG: NAD(+) synthase, partial [Alistipes sp.]|nr:NAD(+) synthase [Alistipes sp.]
MKIALAQLNYTIGDIDGNTAKIIDAVERAKAEGADVVLFAEQAVSGTPAFDLLRKTTFLELCEDALETIARHCDSIVAIVGSPLLSVDGTMSAAVVMQDGRIKHCVTKKHITARREMGFLTSGTGIETLFIAGEKVALVVGDDFRRLKNFPRTAQTIININARRYGKGVLSRRYSSIHDVAFVQSKTVVFVNQVGGSGEIVYDGTSGVMDNNGNLTLMMKDFAEDFAIYDTDIEHEPCVLPEALYRHDRTPFNYRAAVMGLRDYFHKNGYSKACVGLSGGIDSAIVACIAADALGKQNVRGLLMPSPFSPDQSVEDATALAERLGIQYSVLPITEVYTSMINTLKPVIGGRDFDLTEENIQARIRTVMLMAMQNKTSYILLNSSNKSENALGLCTLYGDTAGAFSVTGDLYKSEMYDLARYINRTQNDVIPTSIIEK